VLKKFFLTHERHFLGLLMPFAGGDVRDHIVSPKNDHGPSYRLYRALQRWRRLKIDFREIFGVVRFFDFCNSIPSTADIPNPNIMRTPLANVRFAPRAVIHKLVSYSVFVSQFETG
jgi:hypothetical protein